ncbi:unnamed protein product [Eruca vesicaria subsp. sativa]|uniref:Uncharacterized protein n=1 Tax=Eruca vesicaria subsp. sativa TaxID=29727 RepID=A0ABC8KX56_ERUVS|nr:unnamed protein product [Eruca vesicaria subsp. sativa]
MPGFRGKEAKVALRTEFLARLAKISDSLGSLECVRNRDLDLTTMDGGMAVIQVLQGDSPSSLQAEKDRLSTRRADLVVTGGSFDLVLAELKSDTSKVFRRPRGERSYGWRNQRWCGSELG